METNESNSVVIYTSLSHNYSTLLTNIKNEGNEKKVTV